MIRELLARMRSAGNRAIEMVRAALTPAAASRTVPVPFPASLFRTRVTMPNTQTLCESRAKAHIAHVPVYSLYTFFALAR